MKRLVPFILSILFAFSISGCNNTSVSVDLSVSLISQNEEFPTTEPSQAPVIETIINQKTNKALSSVLSDFSNAIKLDNFFDSTGIITDVYESESGYALIVTPIGFAGPIEMVVGIDKSGNILNISIISHTETAGLGAIAAADTDAGNAFRAQFVGKNGTLSISKDGGTIDAITGATITSRSITTSINAALDCVASLTKQKTP